MEAVGITTTKGNMRSKQKHTPGPWKYRGVEGSKEISNATKIY